MPISREAREKCPGAPMIVVDLVCNDTRHSLAAHAPMAAAIADAMGSGGTCRPGDLLARGFTREEAAARWPVAQALAAIVRLMDLP